MFFLATIEEMMSEEFDLDATEKFETMEDARDFLAKHYDAGDRKEKKIWRFD
jgi:hypothetical protein